ncbi:hypothetical protein STCU_11331 [Strigomonas culicis]|uniref:Uncharacterized protein n=1 Tax=Strigomonas culicis TaxID=28005 RepID=S9THI8_9TRYP|nr:hypothetical protein STCU_11331 [Strigomonas culicis]|eukprot:EPY16384.1 hypothetical protein STCU_11331 [Strigomonas culicis]
MENIIEDLMSTVQCQQKRCVSLRAMHKQRTIKTAQEQAIALCHQIMCFLHTSWNAVVKKMFRCCCEPMPTALIRPYQSPRRCRPLPQNTTEWQVSYFTAAARSLRNVPARQTLYK